MITKFKIFEDSEYKGILPDNIVGFKYSQPDINVKISIPIINGMNPDDFYNQFKSKKIGF